jgi:hypothetical protein
LNEVNKTKERRKHRVYDKLVKSKDKVQKNLDEKSHEKFLEKALSNVERGELEKIKKNYQPS